MTVATTATRQRRVKPSTRCIVALAAVRAHLDTRLVGCLAAWESLGRRVRHGTSAVRKGVNAGPAVAHPDDARRDAISDLSPGSHLTAVVEDPDRSAVNELPHRRVSGVDPQ